MWTANDEWCRKILKEYTQLYGWTPTNPVGALMFVRYVALSAVHEIEQEKVEEDG